MALGRSNLSGRRDARLLQEPLREEIDVMQAVLDGQKDQTIARRLGISVITVRRRVSRFLNQVGAKNRIQGAVVGVQRGWLRLDLCAPGEGESGVEKCD